MMIEQMHLQSVKLLSDASFIMQSNSIAFAIRIRKMVFQSVSENANRINKWPITISEMYNKESTSSLGKATNFILSVSIDRTLILWFICCDDLLQLNTFRWLHDGFALLWWREWKKILDVKYGSNESRQLGWILIWLNGKIFTKKWANNKHKKTYVNIENGHVLVFMVSM